MDLYDNDYYKYFDHSSDKRYNHCKDKTNRREKYWKNVGDFMDFYCRNEKKPIYYNMVFDPTKMIFYAGSVGNV